MENSKLFKVVPIDHTFIEAIFFHLNVVKNRTWNYFRGLLEKRLLTHLPFTNRTGSMHFFLSCNDQRPKKQIPIRTNIFLTPRKDTIATNVNQIPLTVVKTQQGVFKVPIAIQAQAFQAQIQPKVHKPNS